MARHLVAQPWSGCWPWSSLSRTEPANRKSSLRHGAGRVHFEHELLGAKSQTLRKEGRLPNLFSSSGGRGHTQTQSLQPLPRQGRSKGQGCSMVS